jgi:D-alanyl-D-alanine carboxypeptidase
MESVVTPPQASVLDEALERLVARQGVHHAVLAVERGDRSLTWAGAAGEAEPGGPPMRPDTPFHYASVTKLYTATAVMQLWEQGSVDLDATITAYLPADLTDGLHRLDGVDRSEQVTVRHLLSHTYIELHLDDVTYNPGPAGEDPDLVTRTPQAVG